MVEYKMIGTVQNVPKTENTLNELAQKGWRVTGFTQHQILLEREKQDESIEDDGQELLFS